MNYSFSTVLMTVLTSNLLIIIMVLCFRSKNLMLSIGYKLLALFLAFTFLRFLFPVEMPFTRSIPLPEFFSRIIAHMRHVFFSFGQIEVSVWFLFECVWICGIVFMLIKQVFSYYKLRRYVVRYGTDVTEKEPYYSFLREVCDSRKSRIRVALVPNLQVPCQTGIIRPYILLPAHMELPEDELYHIFRHEFSHFLHHDFLFKQGISFLCALYWWNPLCRILMNKLDIILEMRVDKNLIKDDRISRSTYTAALMHVADIFVENQFKLRTPFYMIAPRAVGDLRDLESRLHFIYGKREQNIPMLVALLGMAGILFAGSYCFIFEAYYTIEDSIIVEDSTLEMEEYYQEDMYAILLDDGTYDIYFSGTLIEHVDTMAHYSNVPVINK